MSSYLDTIEEETNNIVNIAFELDTLSRAFYVTGNIAMGDSLGFAYKDLMASQKKINNAVAVEINEMFGQAQQISANMITACLATTK